jgi:hypothetical protein
LLPKKKRILYNRYKNRKKRENLKLEERKKQPSLFSAQRTPSSFQSPTETPWEKKGEISNSFTKNYESKK